MKSIKVVDSIMGSGKTSAAINLMNNAGNDQNFIFITPYLNEVERIKKSVNNRQMYEPKVKKKGTKHNISLSHFMNSYRRIKTLLPLITFSKMQMTKQRSLFFRGTIL